MKTPKKLPVDSKQFIRYNRGQLIVKRLEAVMLIFPVLECVRTLSRVGGLATAHAVARQVGISVYKSRRLLHTLHDLGLTDWEVVNHRPNVQKRVYHLTDRGIAVNHAYFYSVSGGKEE